MKILETFSNKIYEITEEENSKIMEKSILGKTGGIWIGSDYISFGSIKGISEFQQNNSHQPYSNPNGTIWDRSSKKGRELMLSGFKKWLGKNPDAKKAQKFYQELVKGKASSLISYNPKYKTVDEMVTAGIISKKHF